MFVNLGLKDLCHIQYINSNYLFDADEWRTIPKWWTVCCTVTATITWPHCPSTTVQPSAIALSISTPNATGMLSAKSVSQSVYLSLARLFLKAISWKILGCLIELSYKIGGPGGKFHSLRGGPLTNRKFEPLTFWKCECLTCNLRLFVDYIYGLSNFLKLSEI